MSEKSSRDALHKFVNHWISEGKIERRSSDVIDASVFVTYRFRGLTKEITTSAYFFHETRQIQLIDSGWLDADFVYTQFDPKWQSFAVTKGHVLRITGNGPKTGAYEVDIVPS